MKFIKQWCDLMILVAAIAMMTGLALRESSPPAPAASPMLAARPNDSKADGLWTLPMEGQQQLVVLRVIDGDSVEVAMLVGPIHVRIHGIDAPEMNTAEGKKAKLAMQNLLQTGVAQTWDLHGQEKFGRLLADVQITQDMETGWLSWWMVNNGHARAYDGGKR